MPTKRLKDLVQGDEVEMTTGAMARVNKICRSGLFQTNSGRAYEIEMTIITEPEKGKHITEFYPGETLVAVSGNSIAE